MAVMPDYADAIEAIRQRDDQLRDYGGFLAQAWIPLEEAEHHGPLVNSGYARQLQDFPEG